MAMDFPNAPTVGQTYLGYVWDGSAWQLQGGSTFGAVRYDIAQGLSSEVPPYGVTVTQRARGRSNIYAAPFDALAYSGIQVNGSMDVSQELGSVGITASGYICDGWRFDKAGTYSFTAATYPADGTTPAGFARFLAITISVAQASLGAGDYAALGHTIEGYRISRLSWGTANAQPIILGFWTAHHRTGVYSGVVRNNGSTRVYAFNYTQNVADVPQFNVITVPGDVAGTWTITNGTGINLVFSIGCGATFSAPSANSWLTTNYLAGPGQVNAVAATSDIFRITGVIVLPGIEAPSAARVPLIMRPYDQELMTCRRYWQSIGDPSLYPVLNGVATGAGNYLYNLPLAPTMRSTPTALKNGTWSVTNCGQPAVNSVSAAGIVLTVASSAAGIFLTYPTAAGQNITLDARL
jgi:hypothetical protein